MQSQLNNARRKREQLLNVAVMAGGSWLLWYLSGPYAGDAGRAIYESIYAALWGTPSWFSLRFFERAFVYNPNGSHLQHWLYDYAEYICPLIMAPLLYKLPDMIRAGFRRRVAQIEERLQMGDNGDITYQNHVENVAQLRAELREVQREIDELSSASSEHSEESGNEDEIEIGSPYFPSKDRGTAGVSSQSTVKSHIERNKSRKRL